MSDSEKVNGDITIDKTVSTPQTTQRKPRLNRRGLHLLNNPLANLGCDNSVQQNSDINGNNEGSENKSKTVSSQRKVISLTSVKSPSSSSEKILLKRKESITSTPTTTISLKKSSFSTSKRESTESTGISSSSDPPPKKKHKPITWP